MERDVELTPHQSDAVRNMQVTIEAAEKRDKRTSYAIQIVLPNSSHTVWKNSKEFQEFDADWRATVPECHNPFTIPISKKFLSQEENTKIKIAKLQNYIQYMCTLPGTFSHLLKFLGIGAAALPQQRKQRRFSSRSITGLPKSRDGTRSVPRSQMGVRAPPSVPEGGPRRLHRNSHGAPPRLPNKPPPRPAVRIQKLPRSLSVGNQNEQGPGVLRLPKLPGGLPRLPGHVPPVSPKFTPLQVSHSPAPDSPSPKPRLPPKPPANHMPSPRSLPARNLLNRPKPPGPALGRRRRSGDLSPTNSPTNSSRGVLPPLPGSLRKTPGGSPKIPKTRRRVPPSPLDGKAQRSYSERNIASPKRLPSSPRRRKISTRRRLPPRPLTSIPQVPNSSSSSSGRRVEQRQRAATAEISTTTTTKSTLDQPETILEHSTKTWNDTFTNNTAERSTYQLPTSSSPSRGSVIRSQTMCDPSTQAQLAELVRGEDAELEDTTDVDDVDKQIAEVKSEIAHYVSEELFEKCIEPRDHLKELNQERRRLVSEHVVLLEIRIQKCKKESSDLAKNWDFEGCIRVREEMDQYETQKNALVATLS